VLFLEVSFDAMKPQLPQIVKCVRCLIGVPYPPPPPTFPSPSQWLTVVCKWWQALPVQCATSICGIFMQTFSSRFFFGFDGHGASHYRSLLLSVIWWFAHGLNNPNRTFLDPRTHDPTTSSAELTNVS
jgi:hypothetical protein